MVNIRPIISGFFRNKVNILVRVDLILTEWGGTIPDLSLLPFPFPSPQVSTKAHLLKGVTRQVHTHTHTLVSVNIRLFCFPLQWGPKLPYALTCGTYEGVSFERFVQPYALGKVPV